MIKKVMDMYNNFQNNLSNPEKVQNSPTGDEKPNVV